ncbi:hypothetical protein B0H11DRAFT_2387312 [Mycena galericulata]|nr:hypothetical protein B0H11DRAFT_2387312 [Mycena galericulata]
MRGFVVLKPSPENTLNCGGGPMAAAFAIRIGLLLTKEIITVWMWNANPSSGSGSSTAAQLLPSLRPLCPIIVLTSNHRPDIGIPLFLEHERTSTSTRQSMDPATSACIRSSRSVPPNSRSTALSDTDDPADVAIAQRSKRATRTQAAVCAAWESGVALSPSSSPAPSRTCLRAVRLDLSPPPACIPPAFCLPLSRTCHRLPASTAPSRLRVAKGRGKAEGQAQPQAKVRGMCGWADGWRRGMVDDGWMRRLHHTRSGLPSPRSPLPLSSPAPSGIASTSAALRARVPAPGSVDAVDWTARGRGGYDGDEEARDGREREWEGEGDARGQTVPPQHPEDLASVSSAAAPTSCCAYRLRLGVFRGQRRAWTVWVDANRADGWRWLRSAVGLARRRSAISSASASASTRGIDHLPFAGLGIDLGRSQRCPGVETERDEGDEGDGKGEGEGGKEGEGHGEDIDARRACHLPEESPPLATRRHNNRRVSCG